MYNLPSLLACYEQFSVRIKQSGENFDGGAPPPPQITHAIRYCGGMSKNDFVRVPTLLLSW